MLADTFIGLVENDGWEWDVDEVARVNRYIPTKVAAEVAGVPESTMRWWRHVGYGPPSARLGRRVVYREADLLAWIEAQFGEAPAGKPHGHGAA